ncbi:hypothetical protein KIPB_000935 [Kipferlia bialata]|uniref:Uncharacterized protein n=1 Tax=Kipferlia bialata TaxID=797122 RepID=A0A391NZZ3_9EUKA|nr:hypothetical protein KIPB_000935 [Kipferlia bialata]|eukprot:g935.t1
MREEFISGRLEREAGMIVPAYRNAESGTASPELIVAVCQVNHFDTRVLPLLKAHTAYMDRLGLREAQQLGQDLVHRATSNRDKWRERVDSLSEEQ